MFENIDGEKYLKVKEQFDGLKNGTYSDCIIYLNNFFTAVLNFELSEFLKGELIVEKIEVEAYNNLPHILCLLDDLGILDLIEGKFLDKYYKGKARETDKAKLIATILGIEDAKNIRYAIKNKDYLSDKAKENAVKTLKSLGLEPSKFIN